MAPAGTLLLTGILAAAFVPLALTEKRSLALRSVYVLVGMVFTLSLGLLFASLGFERDSGPHTSRVPVERTTPAAVEIDLAARWAARGFGGWLAVLASGELLRLVLKRPAGAELLGPAVLFLAGAVLIEPQWGLGVAFAVGLACVAAVGVWGRPAAAALRPVESRTPESVTS
jgi:hypothetical protein